MALYTKKISQFSTLDTLNGQEYLMVSANGQSYKVPTSVILGTIIKSIEQNLAEGDEAESTITVKTKGINDSTEVERVFTIKNGSKGSEGPIGPRGEKGEPGDSGVIISNIEDFNSIITSDLNSDSTTTALSAAAGKVLAEKISDKKDIYLHSQEAFDILLENNNVFDNVKYHIYDEDDVTEEEIQAEIMNLSNIEGA